MALLPVGAGHAIVLQNPLMSAWGHSREGWIDFYYLEAWIDEDLDGLIKRAVAATPTKGMRDTGRILKLGAPGLIFLYSGDRPGNTIYGEYQIPISAG